MKQLLLTLGIALLGAGCAEVISHADDAIFDAGPGDVKDGTSDVPEAPSGPCSSGTFWLGGNAGSLAMTPGRPCIACHKTFPASPQYSVAGTIYPSSREADDCNGIDGIGVAVAILDEQGMEIGGRIQVTSVGNFMDTRMVPARFRAKIIAGMNERVKRDPVTSGDCNSCHTQDGTMNASGRLRPPMR